MKYNSINNIKIGMKMNIVFMFLFVSFIPSYAFSNDFSSTDFIPRVINFVIFAFLTYVVLKPKISKFFGDRVEEIQTRLAQAQYKSDESRINFLAKKKELSKINDEAMQIVNLAKAQAKQIADELEKNKAIQKDMQVKNNELKKLFATNKFKREVVSQFLDETIQTDKIGLKDNEISSLLLKKAI